MLQLVPSCTPALMTERWTVLIVEDEPILRDLMRRILEKQDYRVLVAENGASAVDVARAHTEGIDLLITDIVMPGVDGFDVAAQLTEIHPTLRVLFLTGYSADSQYVNPTTGVRRQRRTAKTVYPGYPSRPDRRPLPHASPPSGVTPSCGSHR